MGTNLYIFLRIFLIHAKNYRFLPFYKNFVNKNGIKKVTPLNSFKFQFRVSRGKSSFELFGKNESPSKRTKKSLPVGRLENGREIQPSLVKHEMSP